MSESLHAHLDLHIALVLAEEFYGYLLFFFSFFGGESYRFEGFLLMKTL